MNKQCKKVVYIIIYGQCTNTMKQKLETFPEFAPINEKQDRESSTFLLGHIKSICYHFKAYENQVLASIQTQKKYMI